MFLVPYLSHPTYVSSFLTQPKSLPMYLPPFNLSIYFFCVHSRWIGSIVMKKYTATWIALLSLTFSTWLTLSRSLKKLLRL